jgi:hypothetical protein
MRGDSADAIPPKTAMAASNPITARIDIHLPWLCNAAIVGDRGVLRPRVWYWAMIDRESDGRFVASIPDLWDLAAYGETDKDGLLTSPS